MKSPTACLQEGIVLIEPAALLDIEKYITLFHPYIHTYIVTSTWHRFAGVPALRSPDVVAWYVVGTNESEDA